MGLQLPRGRLAKIHDRQRTVSEIQIQTGGLETVRRFFVLENEIISSAIAVKNTIQLTPRTKQETTIWINVFQAEKLSVQLPEHRMTKTQGSCFSSLNRPKNYSNYDNSNNCQLHSEKIKS